MSYHITRECHGHNYFWLKKKNWDYSVKFYYFLLLNYSFQINANWTFGSMMEEIKAFPSLNVMPPLHLKDLGVSQSNLVMLSEGTLSDYDLIIQHFHCTKRD